jgi:uncharacterized protein YegL
MTTQESQMDLSTKMDLTSILEGITCPITGEPMVEAVSGNDGHTYEKNAIVHALSLKAESPMTRQPMTQNDLKVNASIQFLCDKYHQGAFGNFTPRSAPKVSETEIILNHSTTKNPSGTNIMLNFNIENSSLPSGLENNHLSQDLVLVLDHSGSTNIAVEAQDENGKNIENGFSVLDILKHAAKMVSKTLNSQSRLSIVIFDNNVETLFDLMPMSEMNCSQAIGHIERISPGGQTNMWGGIDRAIAILDNREDKSRNSAILVLTDGVPNIRPARGEVDTMKKLRLKKNFTAPVYTFGFGYQLERELLYDLAKTANGGNGHIPDGGLVASVFGNFIATILTTVALNLQLHIKSNRSEKIPMGTIMGDFMDNFDSATGYNVFDLGTVQLEQSRNIVVHYTPETDLSYHFTYKIGGKSYTSQEYHVNSGSIDSISESPENEIEYNRCFTVECLRKMISFNRINQNSQALLVRDSLDQRLTSCGLTDKLTLGLINNLRGNGQSSGQINLAIENQQYFRKWGEFYLDQLSRSLNQQMKPNFKDTGPQFGGEVFEDLVDKASDIFDSLPPSTPSLNRPTFNQSSSSFRSLGNTGYTAPTPPPPAPVSMSAYNNMGGGCFNSKCLITMSDGTFKPLSQLMKNDIIKTVDADRQETTAQVVCILERKITNGKWDLITTPSGLEITKYHPFRMQNTWEFPIDKYSSEIKNCESIITLVLDNHHIGIINGIECIMLGHGFTEGILEHPYLGTNKVIEDMKKMNGWDSGHIVLHDNWVENDPITGLISKIIDTSIINKSSILVS